jgi:hypothetical protein
MKTSPGHPVLGEWFGAHDAHARLLLADQLAVEIILVPRSKAEQSAGARIVLPLLQRTPCYKLRLMLRKLTVGHGELEAAKVRYGRDDIHQFRRLNEFPSC